ncbi:MAG: prepilin-type N-terminal cleavage/methylation domain-containing protein [Candidatus Berkelbacteria bacterium]|nr:prepilin-type N-terminal cleavage/methylation domain-containing protein [Candidatus Berkelbacteria bacterium]
MSKKIKGFTIIELLTVIFIIGILATIIIVKVSSARSSARYAKMLADFKTIANAADMYASKEGLYAPDVLRNIAPAFVPTYIPTWPTSPCPNTVYDWEDWSCTAGVCTGVGANLGEGNVIEVSLRPNPGSGNDRLYFYNIKGANVEHISSAGVMVNEQPAGTLDCP